jgi:transcriptional regulator with XRE-family HTH domain
MRVMAALRVLNGMRQRDLGLLVGRSRPWVTRVERGDILPQRRERIAIALALGVQPETIFRDCA